MLLTKIIDDSDMIETARGVGSIPKHEDVIKLGQKQSEDVQAHFPQFIKLLQRFEISLGSSGSTTGGAATTLSMMSMVIGQKYTITELGNGDLLLTKKSQSAT